MQAGSAGPSTCGNSSSQGTAASEEGLDADDAGEAKHDDVMARAQGYVFMDAARRQLSARQVKAAYVSPGGYTKDDVDDGIALLERIGMKNLVCESHAANHMMHP